MTFFEMTGTVIRSLFKKPATLMYPVRPGKKMSLSRGHVTIDAENCILCRSCQRKCPTGAICVEVKEKAWQIDRLRCVVCNACVDVCPTKCLTMDTQYTPVMTSRAGIYKTPVAGPKKKAPVAAAPAAPAAETAPAEPAKE